MVNVKPKSLEDFPQFIVTALRPGAVAEDGYQSFEIDGSFDPILERTFSEILEGNGPTWFWLLFGKRGCFTPMLKSFDKEARTAVLVTHENQDFKLGVSSSAYLSPYWQAYHVWMVLDPEWGWKRKEFQGLDAMAEDYEAEETSLVGNREIKIWTKLTPKDIDNGQSRHYPAADQTSPVRAGIRLVLGGWGHEHCKLCNANIDPGMLGYCDPDDQWMCESCYERYAARHDLAFVDEL